MNLMENRRKTSNIIPEPQFQFRFVRFLLVGSMVQIALFSLILGYFLNENYTILVKYAGLEPEITQILYRELRGLIGVLGLVFVLQLVGTTVLGLSFSHRVAGAVYAFKRTISQIVAGEDAEIRLRKNDEFQELADSFNHMVRQLKAGSASRRAGGGR